jgi:hypothetical protein
LTDDADNSSSPDSGSTDGGIVGKLKGMLAKVTGAVTGIVKKDDAGAGATGATASGKPTERSKKMKDAVENARKAKNNDDD